MYDKRRCMGYSCMAMTDPDNVGIIYETCHTNGKTGARGIGFIRIPIEAIMTGRNVDAKVSRKGAAADDTADDEEAAAEKSPKKGKKKKKKKTQA